ncbi:penicillin-binding protein activator [Flocculibacter collagenilyticus]|uniref:penicillin-binding protein activator n=1 Tax=Flocculibacter collagenilyticus TaxID=2744479 RepID=UPI0018F60920|nr:penicillin-binding protein activator [Flocculibacter collagenilyticus]
MEVYRYITVAFAFILALVLASCGSAPKKVKTEPVATPIVEPVTQQPNTVKEWVALAEATNVPQQRWAHYIHAARTALANEQYMQSKVIVLQLLTFANLSETQTAQLHILQSQQLLAEQQPSQASMMLKSINRSVISALSSEEQLQFYQALEQAYFEQQQFVNALEIELHIESAFQNTISDEETQLLHQRIWHSLSQLPEYALTTFGKNQFNLSQSSQGWVDLSLTVRRHLGNPTALHQALQLWQQRYSNHPSINQLPDAFQQVLEVSPYNKGTIVLLLQFSGRFKQEALAVRDGLLTAIEHTDTQLHIVDSNQPQEAIVATITELNPDFIIGPLLKSNVDKFIATELYQTVPTLLLNSPSQPINDAAPHLYNLTLSRSDELKQAATDLIKLNFKHPVIVAENNSSGQREAEFLARNWQEQAAKIEKNAAIDIIYFNGTHDMSKAISSTLDVDESKKRISRIKRFTNKRIKSDTRNRRDIDAFYIIANPIQTHLLKPFIDVSISPFATAVPVFASSKSYGNYKTAKKELTNIKFTDMPWIIGSQSKIKSLRSQSQQLWPERNIQQLRLFALGYDSYQLINQLAQMRVLPGQSISGLTGQLSVTHTGNVERKLMWARFNKGKVTRIETPY